MAAKNKHKIRLWDDSYVQSGFTKVIACDKLDNAQCTLCNAILDSNSLIAFEVDEAQETKHKENTDSVEMFKAKRACYNVRRTLPTLDFCLTSQPLLLPN